MKQPDMYGIKRFLRPVVYGIVAGTVACFLLLTFMSVVMQFRDLPQMLITFFATLTFVLGGLVAGYVSAAFSRERGMLVGVCCGICMFLLLAFTNLTVNGPDFCAVAFTKLAAVLFASALGGVVGVNKRKKFR